MIVPLPQPLTPPDSTVAHLPSMLLDVQRLRDSSIANHENPEVFRTSVILWCAAWQQTPAASLDNNDRELAGMAGFSRAMDQWLAIKDEVMAGFCLCADGRWYHPVVAEKALEQMLEHLTMKAAGAKGNASQGKAQSGGRDLQAQMADLAIRLRKLNPKAKVLAKPAVIEAVAMTEQGGEAGDDPAEALSRTNHERSAFALRSQGVEDQDAARAQCEPDADAVQTQCDPTANAVRTQCERSADAIEYNRILSPLPPLPGGDAPPEASRFREAFDAYPEIGRTKIAQAEAIWPDIAKEAGGQDALLSAVRDFAGSIQAKAREGRAVPGIVTWLKRGDWKGHLPKGAASEPERGSSWVGPEDIRSDVVAHVAVARGGGPAGEQAGQTFARTYLDPCAWRDLPERTIVCRSATAFPRLKSQCGALFARLGVDLVLEALEVAA